MTFILCVYECAEVQRVNRCTVMQKKQQYSFMFMSVLLYIDYFVQNVYPACAYVQISFTTNMKQ